MPLAALFLVLATTPDAARDDYRVWFTCGNSRQCVDVMGGRQSGFIGPVYSSLEACDRALSQAKANAQVPLNSRCERVGSSPPAAGTGSGSPLSPPQSGVEGVVRAAMLGSGAGASGGSLVKSNVTGENQWKTGLLGGFAAGTAFGVAVNAKNLPTGAPTVLLGAAGAAAGAAHGQFQKALGNEDTTLRDAAVGAVLGSSTGFAIDVVNENRAPFGGGRLGRTFRRARFVLTGTYAGVVFIW